MTTTYQEGTAMSTVFETEPCSRCGGSGHYSYCQMYGTKCFKCAGYDEVEVGWRVLVSGAGWRTVTGIDLNPAGGRYENYGTPEEKLIPNTHGIETPGVTMVGMADSRIDGYADRAEYDAKRAAALAYQETLTVEGTPRKRSAA